MKNDYEALHPRQNRICDIDTVFFRAVVCMLDVSGLDGEEIHLNKCSFHFDAKRTIATSVLSACGQCFVLGALGCPQLEFQ